VSRRLGAAASLALVVILPGCGGGGGGGSTIGEKALRDCLAQAGIVERPPGSQPSGAVGYAPTFSPDFTAYTRNGVGISVIVQRTDGRARSTAADVRGALASVGTAAGGAAGRVLTQANAVVVFSRVPSSADRDAVRACMSP
jgi:hypothetical protein